MTTQSTKPMPPSVPWSSADHPLDSFRSSIEPEAGEVLLSAAQRTTEVPLDELSGTDLPIGGLVPLVNALSTELSHGRGLSIIDGFPVDEPAAALERFFWGIGLALGTPVSQSVMGERLGHVRDVTKTDPHARAYRNRSELTPHTDPADYLTFLCVHPAARGGVSRFVSSHAIHDAMERESPELLERLCRGFRYHRLGEHPDGSAPITPHRVPVFSRMDGLLSCRYVRQYLEVAAAEEPDIEIDDTDRRALERLEELAGDPQLHHEFTLRRGEAVFANNFTVMHARSGFEDRDGSSARHLLRLWISARRPRPVVPEILHYDGEPGIPAVAGKRPSYATDVEVQ
ncbi:MAG: TauD/TfdA family dioxygenase [Actinomycetota bacterium]